MPDAGEKPSPLKRILDLLKRLLGKQPGFPRRSLRLCPCSRA
jgi:hypothetical protein